MRSPHALQATTVVGVPAIAGLVAGVLGLVGWRYAAPRQLILLGQADPAPGATGLRLVRVNYLQYVSGPSWWPMAMGIPLTGLLLGALVGLIVLRSGRRLADRRPRVVSLVAAGVAAAMTGACAAAFAYGIEPALRIMGGSGPPPADSYARDANSDSGVSVYGAPSSVDLDPISVTFPIIGAMTGIAVALLGVAILRRR